MRALLKFARIEGCRVFLGLENRQEVTACQTEDVLTFAAQLAGFAAVSAPPSHPERWFESTVRTHISAINSTLLPTPVYGQVFSFAAGDRDIIDLLGVSDVGRLAVLELKAAEDIQLPIQALDYWMRVAWHAQRGELQHLFPGVALQRQAPKLLLNCAWHVFSSGNRHDTEILLAGNWRRKNRRQFTLAK